MAVVDVDMVVLALNDNVVMIVSWGVMTRVFRCGALVHFDMVIVAVYNDLCMAVVMMMVVMPSVEGMRSSTTGYILNRHPAGTKPKPLHTLDRIDRAPRRSLCAHETRP